MTEAQVVEYNVTDAAIAEMSNMYMGLVITDLADREQFDAVHSARMVVRGKRIEVDKKRKELKADALAWGKKVQTEANRIFDLIEPIETHLKNEEGKAEAEKERIEGVRINGIQKQLDLLNVINIPETTSGIETLIERLKAMSFPPEVYFEFVSEAEAIREDKLSGATTALERRIRMDKEEAEQKAESERLAAERAELEKNRIEQEEKTRIEREKQEAAAAKIKAEQDEINEANCKIEAEKAEIERVKHEAQEKKARDEFEKQAKIQAEIDAQAEVKRKEAERVEREKARKEEAIRREMLKPDKEKLMAFGQFVESGVTYPNVKSEEAKSVVLHAQAALRELSDTIINAAENL